MSMVNFTVDLSTNKNIMSAPAKPTYQQLVTSALGDYKKQSAQAFFLLVSTLLWKQWIDKFMVKDAAAKRCETDQNKCRHFVKLTSKKMVEKKLITQVNGKDAAGVFYNKENSRNE